MKKGFILFFIIYLLLECNILYLVPQNKYFEFANVIIVIVILLILILKRSRKLKEYFFSKEVLFFLILVLIEIILSFLAYRQKLSSIVNVSQSYLLIISYFIFSHYLKVTKEIKKFELVIIIFSLILSVIFNIQFYLYSNHIIFLKITLIERFDTLRINITTIIPCMGFILAFLNMLNEKNSKMSAKVLYFLNIVSGIIYIVFVAKVRALLLISFFCVLVAIFIRFRKQFVKMTFSLVLLGLILFFVSSTEIAQNYIQSFNTEEASYSIRNQEIAYYMYQMKESPVYGIGFIVPDEGDETYYKLRGEYGLFYTSDVGIFGTLQTFGVVGVVWYIFILFKLLMMMIKIIKSKKVDECHEFIPISLYIMLTSVTLIILDPQRNFMLPIILAMLEYMYLSSVTEEKELEKGKR